MGKRLRAVKGWGKQHIVKRMKTKKRMAQKRWAPDSSKEDKASIKANVQVG
jgi:hypothetical protein